METQFTAREREVIEHVRALFPTHEVAADTRLLAKPWGEVECLAISLEKSASACLDRARVAWPLESPLRLAEAIKEHFELLGYASGRASTALGGASDRGVDRFMPRLHSFLRYLRFRSISASSPR